MDEFDAEIFSPKKKTKSGEEKMKLAYRGHGISPERSTSNLAMRLLVGKKQGHPKFSTVFY